MDAGQIIDLVQMQEGCGRVSKAAASSRPTITAVRRLSVPVVQQKPAAEINTLKFTPTKVEEVFSLLVSLKFKFYLQFR